MDDSQDKSKSDGNKKNDSPNVPQVSSFPEPTGSSSLPPYATGPLQFRVRGSTITGASPPKFLTLDEIMKAAHGFQDMALAHEIAIDHDFRLEPFEPPDNSYQKLVKETLHRAFFDLLREQLNSDPPEYKQALVLLEDVKKGLHSILLPRHTKIKTMVDEVLDNDFIRQQAENGALDFHKYATFVLDLMAKLAAPARDEMIQNITAMTDTVDIFRAILETLEVMKLDLANTLIAMIRPHVQAQSVQYEKNKFDEMLKVQEDGLQYTRAWLIRNLDKSGLSLPVTDQLVIRSVTAQTLAKAYLQLLEWDDSQEYPETVSIDAGRFAELGSGVLRLQCAAAVLLASPSCGDQASAASYKQELKKRILIIIDEVTTHTEFIKILPSLAEEVIQSTQRLLEQSSLEPLTSEVRDMIHNQLTGLRDPQNKVRQIVRQRIFEFLKDILVCGGGQTTIPVGLSAFSEELKSIAGTLLRYVMHNKAVFTPHYMDIIAEQLAHT